MKNNLFSIRLRKAREQKKLLQKELALLLNVNQRTISNWESGTREPSMEMLNKIGTVLNINLEYFFAFDSETQTILKDLKAKDMLELYQNINELDEKALLEYYKTLDNETKNKVEILKKVKKIICEIEPPKERLYNGEMYETYLKALKTFNNDNSKK